jgi:hypothetical protein
MLQDDLQSELSWNLLGTAIRSAQRLGLHMMPSLSREVEKNNHSLMHNIWWVPP